MKTYKTKPISMQVWLTVLVCAVVLVSISVTGYLIGSKSAENAKESQSEKAMDIAMTISHTQTVIDGLTGKGPVEAIQSFTRSVQSDTHVEYIVVMNTDRIRQSHPVPERIGDYFVGGDEERALQGEQYTSTANGTLGESMRALISPPCILLFSTKLTTPAIASEPYSADAPSVSTSMRSIALIGIAFRLMRLPEPEGATRRPFNSTSV